LRHSNAIAGNPNPALIQRIHQCGKSSLLTDHPVLGDCAILEQKFRGFRGSNAFLLGKELKGEGLILLGILNEGRNLLLAETPKGIPENTVLFTQ
jgi:hypothetical protein